MRYFVDMHCHILPGVDDGAKDPKQTYEMLKMAYDEGIRVIVATPHHHPVRGMASKAELGREFRKTKELARQIDENFHVVPGMEVYFIQEVLDQLENNELKAIGKSHYLLVEFSPEAEATYIKGSLQQIQMRGYYPILAHVERYRCMVDNPENVDDLVDMGVTIQVNAGSIVGDGGKKIRKFVIGLMEEGLVHIVGTDAHSTKSRAPKMKKCAMQVEKLFGKDYMWEIFQENGMRILQDKKIYEGEL